MDKNEFDIQDYFLQEPLELTYEKAVEIIFTTLKFSHGELSKFCKEHQLNYTLVSAIKSTFENANKEIHYAPDAVQKMLNILGCDAEIIKPKIKVRFVINHTETKQKILMEYSKKEEIALMESFDLVDFAQHNGYRINEIETSYYRAKPGEKTVGEVTIMDSKTSSEQIAIKKLPTGKYFYININNSHDKGNIIEFVRTRKYIAEKSAITILREYYQAEGISIDTVEDKTTLAEIFSPETFTQEQKEFLKDFFGMREQLYDKTILKERGISDKTINHPCFQGAVFNKEVFGEDGKKIFTNTVFPVYTLQDGVFLTIGLEEVTSEYRNPVSLLKVVDDSMSEAGLWVSKPNLGTWKKDGSGKPELTFYIGESALDCMAFVETNADKLKENYVFISTVGPYDGMKLKLRMLQDMVDIFNPDKIVLINKGTIAGKRADIMLYAQTYQGGTMEDDPDFGRYYIRTEEQSFSPKISTEKIGQGKALITIEIPYKDMAHRAKQNDFVKQTIKNNMDIRDVENFRLVPCDSRQTTFQFIMPVNDSTLDNFLEIVKTIQPEKQLFMMVTKSQSLDYSLEASIKKERKKEIEEKKKIGQSKGITLGLDRIQ